MAAELGGAIGRSSRRTCFILGAGCSLSSGAPTTEMIHEALRAATKVRFEGLDLRKALHSIPEPEKQDILGPLFKDIQPGQGYMALAGLARHRPITVLNLNWDDALSQACRQAGVSCETRDINNISRSWSPPDGVAVLDVHVHGVIGEECRYGTLETLNFTSNQITWLLNHGLSNTTAIIGASLHEETDMAVLFGKYSQSVKGFRLPSSQWFFVRGAELESPEDRLRQVNVHAQPLTYVRDPDVDFDTVAIILADRAVGTIYSARGRA